MNQELTTTAPMYPADAWEVLGKARFSPSRLARMESAARQRTNFVRLVVQDIHSPHNISACMRSAEAFGILNVDIVNLKEKFRASTVSRGVEKWLRVRKYRAISACVSDLKAQGYKIVAGMPSQQSTSLYDLPIDQPTAVVFGNEHEGIAPEWLPFVDEVFTIPMVGLVESLNISVSAALTLAELTRRAKLHQHLTSPYELTPSEVGELLNEWTCRQVASWEAELNAIRHQSLAPAHGTVP